MKTIFYTSFSILLFAASAGTMAGDVKNGKKLYQENCDGVCHDTRVHTRPNRIIHTYPDLVNRVKFCDTQTKSNFSDAQIQDVADYLNSEFYKFVKD
jgi:mono/diheme cytochrome c family protein